MREANWRVVGVSVQGASHRAAGLPCQDAHYCRTLPTGETIIAVADGAGSAPYAAEGAACAAVTAASALAGQLTVRRPEDAGSWTQAMIDAYAAAQQAIDQIACAAERPARDFATTLICVVLAGEWLVTAQLGDGWAVARSGDETFLAARPQRGEYANEAYFLTMAGALRYVEVNASRRPVDAVAVSTDGLLRLALRLPAQAPHEPFFRPLFEFVAGSDGAARARAELVRFLDLPRLCARTDDDKTLALAVRVPPTAEPWPDGRLLALQAPALVEEDHHEASLENGAA